MPLSKDDYIRVGYRLPGRNLVDQARATLDAIKGDFSSLKAEDLLDDAEVKAAKDLVAAVDQGLKDTAIAEAESRAGTGAQDDLVRALKLQRRRLLEAASRALRGSTDYDAFVQATARGSSIPKLKEDVKRKLAIVDKNASAFGKKGASARFVALVKKTLADLETADAAQETSLGSLPAKTRDFCELKGKLYYAVKDLNAAAHALYAGDVAQAALYNMKILYRRGTRKAKAEKGAGEEK